MPTGEQPQIIVDQHTAVRWPVLVALISLAALGAVGLARAQDAGVKADRSAVDVQSLQIHAAKTDQRLDSMLEILKEIKSDVKEMKNAKK